MFDYDKLSALISKSGKSKAHLCRAMGKPEYYLRDVLKQKTIIPDDLQIILAAELGTSVEFLNGIEEKEKAPTGFIGRGEEAFLEYVDKIDDLDTLLSILDRVNRKIQEHK